MSNFCIRLQLSNAPQQKYNELHEAMSRAGYQRWIMGDDGAIYHLPWGEYRLANVNATAPEVLIHVQGVVLPVYPYMHVLVTQEVQSAWSGLATADRIAA